MRFTEAYSYSRKIVTGLIFSCIGDALLVWQNEGYFLYGLACFSIAQVFYISAFGFRPFNPAVALLSSIYAAVCFYMLYPSLSGILIGCGLIYSLLICTMFWRSVSRVQFFDDLWTWTKLCSCFGATLFVISDTVLAFDHFQAPIPYGQPIIMLTYYLAQLGISLSVVDSHVEDVNKAEWIDTTWILWLILLYSSDRNVCVPFSKDRISWALCFLLFEWYCSPRLWLTKRHFVSYLILRISLCKLTYFCILVHRWARWVHVFIFMLSIAQNSNCWEKVFPL